MLIDPTFDAFAGAIGSYEFGVDAVGRS